MRAPWACGSSGGARCESCAQSTPRPFPRLKCCRARAFARHGVAAAHDFGRCGVVLKSIWGRFEIQLKSAWGRCRVHLGVIRDDRFGAGVGPTRGPSWYIRGRPGATLGSIWGRSGVDGATLGSILGRSSAERPKLRVGFGTKLYASCPSWCEGSAVQPLRAAWLRCPKGVAPLPGAKRGGRGMPAPWPLWQLSSLNTATAGGRPEPSVGG